MLSKTSNNNDSKNLLARARILNSETIHHEDTPLTPAILMIFF
jgi:hypothetical protein